MIKYIRGEIMEDKIKVLANTIVNHSIKVEKDENVRITMETMEPIALVKELVKLINEKGASVKVDIIDSCIEALCSKEASSKKIELLKKEAEFEVTNYDSFIKIYCNQGDYNNSIISNEKAKLIGEALKKYRDIRANEKKWVLLQYPSVVDSQKAGMNYDDFKDFSFDSMCYDYEEMAKDLKPLKELMEKTDKVRLTGEGTDITFSIKDIPVIPCSGECNIPDGECFTAPVKNSINGVIKYNTPSPYRGKVFHGVTLEFKDGKIIKATCDESDDELNEIFDTDEGARYVGEFSIGTNPNIRFPMGDILFDEKIIGSIHFTPGACYKEAPNSNSSAIHWDMVLIQRDDFGGGNIYFDDVLIRENGVFVVDSLKHLNK